MTGHCPHLGLAGDRHQVAPVPGPRHRCHVRGQPERVAEQHQAAACLTTAYPRCPRLLAVQARPAVDRPTLAQPRPGRRPLTGVEVVVAGLLVCIVLAGLFVGYSVWHRFQVGPGMRAAPLTGKAGVTAVAQPSLVPTFTPTPLPTATAVAVAGEPPTSIPEPTLPLPTAIARPPAQSPPTRLVIPALQLDIPVMPVAVKTIQEGGQSRLVWADLPRAGGFHATSAYPGSGGNTVINGHRDIQGAVFRHLDRVQVGDDLVLYVGDVAYPYRVAETLVVPETFASAGQRAENLRLIGPMAEERLTLVTCTPVGLATHRLLVIARPPEAVPTPAAGP